MIKFDTIGMTNSEKNFPYVKAHTDLPNWSFVAADFVENETVMPTAETAKKDGLFLIENTPVGDFYDSTVISKGTPVNLKSLKSLDQQFLVVDNQHITYESGMAYENISTDTLLGVGTDGKLEVISSADGYSIYFSVCKKVRLTENAVRAQIIVA